MFCSKISKSILFLCLGFYGFTQLIGKPLRTEFYDKDKLIKIKDWTSCLIVVLKNKLTNAQQNPAHNAELIENANIAIQKAADKLLLLETYLDSGVVASAEELFIEELREARKNAEIAVSAVFKNGGEIIDKACQSNSITSLDKTKVAFNPYNIIHNIESFKISSQEKHERDAAVNRAVDQVMMEKKETYCRKKIERREEDFRSLLKDWKSKQNSGKKKVLFNPFNVIYEFTPIKASIQEKQERIAALNKAVEQVNMEKREAADRRALQKLEEHKRLLLEKTRSQFNVASIPTNPWALLNSTNFPYKRPPLQVLSHQAVAERAAEQVQKEKGFSKEDNKENVSLEEANKAHLRRLKGKEKAEDQDN